MTMLVAAVSAIPVPPLRHLLLAVIAAAILLRIFYVACSVLRFHLEFRRQNNNTAADDRGDGVRFFIILGGCGAREEVASRYIASLVQSHKQHQRLPHVWVLSPARKKVEYYRSYGLLRQENSGNNNNTDFVRLRIACESVDTVSNFSLHATEIAELCSKLNSRKVLVLTCPQHVSRAQAVANAVLLPLRVSARVVGVVAKGDDGETGSPPAAASVAASPALLECERCLGESPAAGVVGSLPNGRETWQRLARDVCRALLWTLFRVDGSVVAQLWHSDRHCKDRIRFNFESGKRKTKMKLFDF